jgi:hypothetical protein
MSSKGTYPWSLAYPCALRAPRQVCNKVNLRCFQGGSPLFLIYLVECSQSCADDDCTLKLIGIVDQLGH